MRNLALVAALTLATPAIPALAADGTPARPLSLPAATARALAKNQDVSIEMESVKIATSAFKRAEGSYDPSFHLEGRYREHTDPVNSILSGAPAGKDAPDQSGLFAGASLGQLLPTGGTVSFSTSVSRDRTNSFFAILSPAYTTSFGIDLRQPLLQNRTIDPVRLSIRVAASDRSASIASLKRTVSETVAAVDRAYWSLVAARRDLAVRRSSVSLAEEQHSDTEAKIKVGVLPETDIAQPVAEVERRKGELYFAEENVKRADLQLKSLLVDDPNDPIWAEEIDPTDSPEAPSSAVDLAADLKYAEANRPELEAAAARMERAKIQQQATRDRILPQLDLVASYARRGLAGTQNPNAMSIIGGPVTVPPQLDGGFGRSLGTVSENRFPDASIGLAFTLPIGNRAAKADAVAAESVLRQASLTFEKTRQQVLVEVRNAANAVVTAAQRIEAARAAREAAETQLRAEKERFGVGLSTNFFVLTRQNDLAQARVTETAALTDYRKARTELARAAGTLLAERKIAIRDDASSIATEGDPR